MAIKPKRQERFQPLAGNVLAFVRLTKVSNAPESRLVFVGFFFLQKKVAPPRLYEGGHPKNQLLKDI
jgi:hypothetical protein